MNTRNVLSLVFSLSASFAIAQDAGKTDSFKINVKVPPDAVVKNLQLNGEDRFIQVMNLKLKNRTFRGTVSDYGIFGLYVDYYDSVKRKMTSNTIPLFIVPGETEISFDKRTALIQINGKSAIPRLEWALLDRDDQDYVDRFLEYEGQENDAVQSGNREKAEIFRKKIEEVQNARREEVYGRFVRKNPNSVVSLYAMNMYSALGANPPAAEALMDRMTPSQQNTPSMIKLRARIEKEKTVMVGAEAPVFVQSDTSGKPVALKDFQGSYVLLDFWASWCKPCRAQNPGIVRLYNKFKGKNFAIVGISLDQKKESWTQAIRQDKLGWYQVSDLHFWSNEVAKLYLVNSVPQNFLIDPQGKIIAKNLSEEEADALLEKLLKNGEVDKVPSAG